MSQPRKQEKDYTKEVEELKKEVEGIAKVGRGEGRKVAHTDRQQGNLQQAIDKISALEKQTRNVSDHYLPSQVPALTTGRRYEINLGPPNPPRPPRIRGQCPR